MESTGPMYHITEGSSSGILDMAIDPKYQIEDVSKEACVALVSCLQANVSLYCKILSYTAYDNILQYAISGTQKIR